MSHISVMNCLSESPTGMHGQYEVLQYISLGFLSIMGIYIESRVYMCRCKVGGVDISPYPVF